MQTSFLRSPFNIMHDKSTLRLNIRLSISDESITALDNRDPLPGNAWIRVGLIATTMEEVFSHKLPGEHVYDGVLFFGYSPPEVLDEVKTFPVRDDDVFIVTYPKAGTTWMQEILWLVMNDGDFEGAKKKQVYFRSPFLEFKDTTLNEIGLDLADVAPSPRIIKTHLSRHLAPAQLWQKPCKKVVLFRNPKDLCVSYYHFYRSSSSMGNYSGDWHHFLKMFCTDHVEHGSWFDFTRSWWETKDRENVKIVFYEDMKKDLAAEVSNLADFLGKALPVDVVSKIADHCSFDNMRQNPMTNHEDVYSINSKISPLLRKGTVGDWKNQYTVEQSELFDDVYRSRLGNCKIPFKYEI